MNAIARKALNAYQRDSLKVEVESASPYKLVVMLYEGAIKAINMAKMHMQQGNVAEKGIAVSRAISIIEDGLRLSLEKEKGGQLAENLDALYEYMGIELLRANLHNDVQKLEHVLRLLTDLKEAWDQIDPAITNLPETGQEPVEDQSRQEPLSYGRV